MYYNVSEKGITTRKLIMKIKIPLMKIIINENKKALYRFYALSGEHCTLYNISVLFNYAIRNANYFIIVI